MVVDGGEIGNWMEAEMQSENMCSPSAGQMESDNERREPSIVIVQRALETKRRQVVALEHLERMLTKGGVETGSPLEELLWEMLSNSRRILR